MTTYYVSKSGSNSGKGTESSPWLTITKAMNSSKLKPGDELIVKAGTYNEQVMVMNHGSAAADIVIRSEKPGAAKIVAPDGKFGIIIVRDYVQIDGFEIVGGKAGITANRSHHIKITDNIVHGATGHGISVNRSDFVKVDGNTVYDNARKGPASGISIWHAENTSGETTTSGYRTIVSNNISYSNVRKEGPRTDGNGIIIDSLNSKDGSPQTYKFKTLVENNIVYHNSGKGIQLAWSDYVTVRNNTSYHNATQEGDGTWRGELSNMNSSHNNWVNNIAVANTATSKANAAINDISYNNYPDNTDVVWSHNLTFNGKVGDPSIRTTGNSKPTAGDGNLLGVNPNFVNAPANFDQIGRAHV